MVSARRLPLITSLRFLAAFDVLVFHCGGDLLQTTATPIQNLFKNGYEAVIFFFLLSGFVLTYSHSRPQEFTSRSSLKSYYIARLARIYPVYLLGLLISAPIFWYAARVSRILDSDVFLTGLVLVPTLLQAWYPPSALAWNSPAWSLSVEAAFYAVLPLMVRRFSSRSLSLQLGLSLGLLCLVEILRRWLAVEIPPLVHPRPFVEENFVAYFPLFFAPVFMFGSALAGIYARCPFVPRIANLMFNTAGASVLGLFCLRSHLPSWALSNIVLVPLFGAVILGATSSTGWPSRLLSARWLILLGDSSYALYILHGPLNFWLKQLAISGPQRSLQNYAVTVLFLFIMVALSIMCYLYVEAPIQRRFRRPASVQPCEAPPAVGAAQPEASVV